MQCLDFWSDMKLSCLLLWKGRITHNGIPVSGMEIVRELSYGGYNKGEPVIDYALTDTNGEFSFNEVKVKSNAPGNI